MKPERLRVAAYGLAQQEGRLLLCRVCEPDHADHGKWTLPGGGLDFGEDPREGVRREVREETGLDVQVLEVAGVDSVVLDLPSETLHAIRIMYHVAVCGGHLCPEVDGSTDDCRWFEPGELDSIELVPLVWLGIHLAQSDRP